MAGSQVVVLRQAITDGLMGMERLAGVHVSYTWDKNADALERVFTVNARSDATDPAALRSGRNYRNDRGRFQIVVLVRIPDADPEDIEARALFLGSDVEDFLGDRKSNELGITGLNSIRLDGWTLDGGWSDTGYVAELTYDVVYTARVT